LGNAAGNQLHTSGNNVWTGVFDQKMDVVGGDMNPALKGRSVLWLRIPSANNGADRAQTGFGCNFLARTGTERGGGTAGPVCSFFPVELLNR
jgi:hypothetical protein